MNVIRLAYCFHKDDYWLYEYTVSLVSWLVSESSFLIIIYDRNEKKCERLFVFRNHSVSIELEFNHCTMNC